MEYKLRSNAETGAEFLKRSLEILEWGDEKEWKNIPIEKKGVISSEKNACCIEHSIVLYSTYSTQSRFRLPPLYIALYSTAHQVYTSL